MKLNANVTLSPAGNTRVSTADKAQAEKTKGANRGLVKSILNKMKSVGSTDLVDKEARISIEKSGAEDRKQGLQSIKGKIRVTASSQRFVRVPGEKSATGHAQDEDAYLLPMESRDNIYLNPDDPKLVGPKTATSRHNVAEREIVYADLEGTSDDEEDVSDESLADFKRNYIDSVKRGRDKIQPDESSEGIYEEINDADLDADYPTLEVNDKEEHIYEDIDKLVRPGTDKAGEKQDAQEVVKLRSAEAKKRISEHLQSGLSRGTTRRVLAENKRSGTVFPDIEDE